MVHQSCNNEDGLFSSHSSLMSSDSSVSSSSAFDANALADKLKSFDDCYFGGHESMDIDFLTTDASGTSTRKQWISDDSLYIDVVKDDGKLGNADLHRSGALERILASPTPSNLHKPTKRRVKEGTRPVTNTLGKEWKQANNSNTRDRQPAADVRKLTPKPKESDEDFVTAYMRDATKHARSPQPLNPPSAQTRDLSSSLRRRSKSSEIIAQSTPGSKNEPCVSPLTPSAEKTSLPKTLPKCMSRELDSSTHSNGRIRPTRRREMKELESPLHRCERHRSSSPQSSFPTKNNRDLDSSAHSKSRNRPLRRPTESHRVRRRSSLTHESLHANTRELDSSTHSYSRSRRTRPSTESNGTRRRSSSLQLSAQNRNGDLDSSTHSQSRTRPSRQRTTTNLDSSTHSRRNRQLSNSQHARPRSPRTPGPRRTTRDLKDLNTSTHSGATRRRPRPRMSSEHRGSDATIEATPTPKHRLVRSQTVPHSLEEQAKTMIRF
eukprot:scaffold770_cov109-Cylindrotheca_fusiformis.AAC.3